MATWILEIGRHHSCNDAVLPRTFIDGTDRLDVLTKAFAYALQDAYCEDISKTGDDLAKENHKRLSDAVKQIENPTAESVRVELTLGEGEGSALFVLWNHEPDNVGYCTAYVDNEDGAVCDNGRYESRWLRLKEYEADLKRHKELHAFTKSQLVDMLLRAEALRGSPIT